MKPIPTPCTCAMLRRTSRRVTQIYDQALRPAGLRLTQYSVLAHLSRHSPAVDRGGRGSPADIALTDGMSITELAERLAMDRSTLTRNLRPMVRAGWIRVGPGSNNRQRAVQVTPPGRARFEEARPLWQEAERRFRRAVGKSEAERLRVLLDRVLVASGD